MEAPPIGLRPRHIVNELRIQEIKAAIERYADACMPPPVEWLQELADLKRGILELSLCTQNHVILKENQLYRFIAEPDCPLCHKLKAAYPKG